MAHSPDEWMLQADYDLGTAEYMLRGDRRFYAAQVATRYTEDLAKLQHEFNAEVAGEILAKAREMVQWAKSQL